MFKVNNKVGNQRKFKIFKMAEAGTLFNEENMKVIRNIFKEEFEKQEKNLRNLISANFKIIVEEIKKSEDEIKNLGKEICDLTSSLEFSGNVLKKKIKKLEERCENMETELQEFYNNQIDPEYVYNKLVDIEDRSRRCNLRIDGVTKREGETWEKCEDEIQNVFMEKLGLENIDIERAYRSKGKTSSNKPRTIVCKLLSDKQKKEVLKNLKKLKGNNAFINEDFCFEIMQRRKELWEKVKRLRSEGQITFLNYWSIVVKGKRDSGD